MKISIVGNGNVAQNLALAFSEKGHSILEMYAPNQKKLKDFTSTVPCKALSSLEDLNKDTDVVILAVNDTVLPEVIRQLPQRETLYLHCSGSCSIDVFRTTNLKHYGVFYPLYSFVKGRKEDFSNIPILIESNNSENQSLIQDLALSLTPNVRIVESSERIYYHLSGILVNNFSNHLWALTQDLLNNQKLDFEAVKPILLQTAENAIKADSLKKIQTGPAKRKNTEIIEKHLSLLNDNPALQDLYKKLSLSIYNYK